MILRALELEDFRNYRQAAISFSPGVNILTGQNAQGKTNLLEAVYYLCGARSFRTRTDLELIGHEADSAAVRGRIYAGEREQRLDIFLSRRERKKILVNGVRMKSAAALSGRLSCVLFSPDDLELVKGGAAARRRFMDLAIGQLRPRYAAALSEHNRILAQKIRILRDYRQRQDMLALLDDYGLQLARTGAELLRYRASWCRRASEAASRLHADISGVGELLRLGYRTVPELEDPAGCSRGQALEALLAQQERLRNAELEAGQCLAGVQRDDLLLLIGGRPAAKFGSQGQMRTAVLALKLAEWEIARDELGESPLLLLDDVLSELDELRQDYIRSRIGGGQVLITCCDPEEVRRRGGGRLLRIEHGCVFPPQEAQPANGGF